MKKIEPKYDDEKANAPSPPVKKNARPTTAKNTRSSSRGGPIATAITSAPPKTAPRPATAKPVAPVKAKVIPK